ncbi:hypothetical protein B296_00018553 [Ensete ventricosum]|uniref:Uncharacterized protein n=1 Tax=Ensete ventricosum TaxID=4639 RepID=A0A427A4J0_ENSVE|nr:hypothetical protein B296_00018553 [Ensete ventricosum]
MAVGSTPEAKRRWIHPEAKRLRVRTGRPHRRGVMRAQANESPPPTCLRPLPLAKRRHPVFFLFPGVPAGALPPRSHAADKIRKTIITPNLLLNAPIRVLADPSCSVKSGEGGRGRRAHGGVGAEPFHMQLV